MERAGETELGAEGAWHRLCQPSLQGHPGFKVLLPRKRHQIEALQQIESVTRRLTDGLLAHERQAPLGNESPSAGGRQPPSLACHGR